ncbi:hypothetical protein G6F57_012240 [Rhizopus arrhizus]|uniref:Uncharacterized protein n=1 Tax=Rhizopus oryzae TaxID=64495 RepID=A0A9P6WWG7_RHIOR|nr:hypothetical protein G6F30_011834 [Rhizopus arrhizus]KAG0977802.1 hypothetical protein G6F29_009794 [Rhizopus arrhizus]KAG0991525.1 hypothetical protein G6F28_008508 [Rhizopus arrhizus]KAG1007856.1 hypothetical protein G6F27_007025 [Rhizopus arrhizus]KAG1021092.1 hypothetical protein G6F26_008747 [Rhizopus arrhizus]
MAQHTSCCLEEALEIDTKFDKAVEQLPQALNFYWKMKCLLRQTVDAINELESEHKKVLKQCRFISLPVENLPFLVNPNIMRLTEAEDKADLSETGPFYTNKKNCLADSSFQIFGFLKYTLLD